MRRAIFYNYVQRYSSTEGGLDRLLDRRQPHFFNGLELLRKVGDTLTFRESSEEAQLNLNKSQFQQVRMF